MPHVLPLWTSNSPRHSIRHKDERRFDRGDDHVGAPVVTPRRGNHHFPRRDASRVASLVAIMQIVVSPRPRPGRIFLPYPGPALQTSLPAQHCPHLPFPRRSRYRRVRIRGSPSVTATVSSTCADKLPSAVTTVQPSGFVTTANPPALTIGSMANTIPGRNSGP